MAVEVEAAGQVDEFLRILRRRIWWIIIPVAVLGSLGTFFAVVVPKKYVVSTKVMVRDGDEEMGRLGQEASTIEGAVAKINITSPARIDTVLTGMRLDDFGNMSETDRSEYREDLVEDLRVSTPTMARDANQQLVEITFQHTEAETAKQFIDRLTDSWIKEVLQRHLNRAETELAETREKLNDLVKSRAQIVEDLKALRTEFKIPPPSQLNILKNDALPASFEQESALTVRVAELDMEIDELNRSIELREQEWAAMPPFKEGVASVQSDSKDKRIETIEDQILSLQDEMQKGNYSPSHSKYRLLQDRIRDLQSSIQEIRQSSQRVQFESTSMVENIERNQLRLKIDASIRERDQAIRRRNGFRERLAKLDSENEQLQDAIAQAQLWESNERSQTEQIDSLRVRSNELQIQVRKLRSDESNPFEVIEKAIVPTKPTSPNPWVIAFGSIFFGLALGFGLAILKEYSKSCFRSARELNRVMTHPVLGTVNAIRTRRERARDFLLRSVLGGGSLLFVLSVGYVTWAFAKKQEALTTPLVDAIKTFQEMLK